MQAAAAEEEDSAGAVVEDPAEAAADAADKFHGTTQESLCDTSAYSSSAAAGALLLQLPGRAATPDGKGFPSADAAAQALVNAAKSDDVAGLIAILGPSAKTIVATGDPVEDRTMRRTFAARAAQKIRLVPMHGSATAKTLLAGKDEWPMPIPIVQRNGQWYFDTAQGKEEILTRTDRE